jgi:hypothetical protein
MRTSRNVVFDESHPFYLHPSSNDSPSSLVDPLSFLLSSDAPPAPLPISHSTLPPFVSSSGSSPVIPNYTVKPPVTQFYNCRGARLSDALSSSDGLSSNVPSSSSVEDVYLLLLLSPPLWLILLLSSSLDVVTTFIGLLTITLLLLSQPLLFLSQTLIVMLFFIRNGNTR